MSDPRVPPPLISERANPPGASADSEWKTYAPSGEQRLVLSAIDNQLNVAKNSWRQRHGDKPGNTDDEFFMKSIDQTVESLKKQLESVTMPVAEAEVERALDSFHTRLLTTVPPFSSPRSDNDSLSSVNDEEEEEIEFDDNIIIDQDAYKQVKHLRRQAREISARVISIREETTGRALDMTRRNLSELVQAHGFSENVGEDKAEETTAQAYDPTEKRDSLNPMHIALQTLTSSLQHVDSGLVEKLESLKESIGTIDSSIEKYQRLSQGDENALSQTEKALLACEKTKEPPVESLQIESPMNPDKKLARLLARGL
eukprot:CAMPEP_0181121920 /NCGR_PEP_ID=MMETSP1071-20121207/25015_1 /TAXON_ID=35127 /ORGANISM="Thalassiosira sp., Strain NH16" /LENGTH=313 /DNA_ID=CAMNT_0023206811 /DNA_START=26 /DNA_END=967 /DNA_ORIENTATION=+